MPPFGFGLSMPFLRKAGAAPFVPVTLVQENWVGFGNVNNRTPAPISGDGTWQVDISGGATVSFDSSYARADQYDTGVFRHSVTFTDASIVAELIPSYTGSGNAFVAAWARSTPGGNATPTSGYSVLCYDVAPGSTPITLRKLVSGVETVLGTSATDPTGQIVTFTVAGSSLTVKVGGATVLQVADASITTAGYWGYEVDATANDEGESVALVGPVTIQTA